MRLGNCFGLSALIQSHTHALWHTFLVVVIILARRGVGWGGVGLRKFSILNVEYFVEGAETRRHNSVVTNMKRLRLIQLPLPTRFITGDTETFNLHLSRLPMH